MRTNKEGLELIKSFESCRLESYFDGKVWTIGYGHTGEDVKEGMDITQLEANNLLYRDIMDREAQLVGVLKHEVNDNQFSALMSFMYNLGIGNLHGSTLLAKVNAGEFKDAAEEFPKWDRFLGKEMEGLLRRRLAEQALFVKPSVEV